MVFQRRPADRVYATKQHRANRSHWQSKRLPCARCGRAIDYDGPRYLTVRGRKVQNPRALVVGHIVSVRRGRQLGWTDDQLNALSNSQPECQLCSNSSGAREGQRAQQQPSRMATSRW